MALQHTMREREIVCVWKAHFLIFWRLMVEGRAPAGASFPLHFAGAHSSLQVWTTSSRRHAPPQNRRDLHVPSLHRHCLLEDRHVTSLNFPHGDVLPRLCTV